MKAKLKRLIPTRDSVQQNRWLRWLGPTLLEPRLWHMGRRGIALGVALGVFFGFLIPIAQIPASATMAVVLRANVPMAIASTLVTNPVTFGPIYYAAYRLGSLIVDAPPVEEAALAVEETTKAIETANTYEPGERITWGDRAQRVYQHVTTVGKPLLVGLSIMAVICSVSSYFLISGIWRLRTLLRRNKRLRTRRLEILAESSQPARKTDAHRSSAPPSSPDQPSNSARIK